jgi:hypothetical protein
MTTQLSLPRRSLLALASATLLAVSACGGSSKPTQVSSAVKSRIESALERDAGLTPAQATQVTNCLAPTLKAHGITTLAAAKAYGNAPAWATSATKTCVQQAGLTSSNTST